MTITSNLFGDGFPVLLDSRTPELGGSFDPTVIPVRPYSPLPLRWAYDHLIVYPRAVLLDIGASTGCYTLLSKHHPQLEVHAFEPVSLTHEVLSENVRLNELGDRVTVNRMGVSNYGGFGVLHTIRQTGGVGVSMVDGYPSAHKDTIETSVEVTTVDDYCRKHDVVPTMIKVDVEGAEFQVLQGAFETIQRFNPFILCEYSAENALQYGYKARDIIAYLEDLGYYWTQPDGDIFAVHRNWESIK